MLQFTVPQFIDVEDKIIGPITVRQFIIMLVAGFFMFLEYKLSDFALFALLAVITAVVFGALAFIKINGMPFHYFLLNIAQTMKKPAIRIWKREFEKSKTTAQSTKSALDFSSPSGPRIKPISRSRLAELSLVVDTGGAYEAGEAEKTIDANFTK